MIIRINHFFHGVLLLVGIVVFTLLFYLLISGYMLRLIWECGKNSAVEVCKKEARSFNEDIQNGFYRALSHLKRSLYGTAN